MKSNQVDWTMFVQCSDKRFQVATQQLRKHLGIKKGHYDPISVPGGAGNFDVLQSSMKTLDPFRPQNRRAVLTVHEDCAAQATRDHLIQSIQLTQEFFPEVVAYFLKLDGSFELVEHVCNQSVVIKT